MGAITRVAHASASCFTATLQPVADGPVIVGEAVLRNYPLRLWHRSFEHTQDLMREFQLIVSAGSHPHDVPHRLLEMADMFITRFGPQIDAITAARQAALDAGLDAFDSVVPMPAETMEIVPAVTKMLDDVDDYCRRGDLLTLARPADQVALQTWTLGEVMAQFQGAPPTPWDGPLD